MRREGELFRPIDFQLVMFMQNGTGGPMWWCRMRMAIAVAAVAGCGARTSAEDIAEVGRDSDATPTAEVGCVLGVRSAPDVPCYYLYQPDMPCGGAFRAGSCPATGLVGCCVVTGACGFVSASCYYSDTEPELLEMSQSACNPNVVTGYATVAWQRTPP